MASKTPSKWEDAVATLLLNDRTGVLVRACFYDDPLFEAARRYWESSEWIAVRRYLAMPPGSALDIGAGRGISSFALAKDGWSVTALEPDPSDKVGAGAIRALAAETALDISVVQDWGETLPFPAATYNVVHCRQVLHHAKDLDRLCKEIGRVLKPGGVFIATREHVISRSEDLQPFLDAHPLHRYYGGENAFLLHQYRRAIKGGGMAIESTLNPYASDINLYPETRMNLKTRWANRVGLPIAALIPDTALRLVGHFQKTPGRLYTFICRKSLYA